MRQRQSTHLSRGTFTAAHLGPALRLLAAMAVLLALFAALVSPGRVLAQEDDERSLEERAQSLDRQIICPVCPGETLNQSRATLAVQMRAVLRERLAEGQSEQEIKDYFVSVYGDSVLASPPTRGFSLTVWVVPPVGLLMGAVAVFFAIRTLRRPPMPAPAAPSVGMANDEELEHLLALVDEEMEGKGGPKGPRRDAEGGQAWQS